jgi:hypothetical protein
VNRSHKSLQLSRTLRNPFHALQHGADGQGIFLRRQSIAGNPQMCADDHIPHRKDRLSR